MIRAIWRAGTNLVVSPPSPNLVMAGLGPAIPEVQAERASKDGRAPHHHASYFSSQVTCTSMSTLSVPASIGTGFAAPLASIIGAAMVRGA